MPENFFVPTGQVKNGRIFITGTDAAHIRNVLRMGTGDTFSVIDGHSNQYQVVIEKMEHEKIVCRIAKCWKKQNEQSRETVLVQAIPKGSKMDFIIEKATELGVSRIVPVITERTIHRPKVLPERWKRLAKQASQQCGRTDLPEVSEITAFRDLLAEINSGDLVLVAWEGEEKSGLAKAVSSCPGAKKIWIIIGPEGGFSQDEICRAKSAGAVTVSMGKRILRAETAGMAALAIIQIGQETAGRK